MIPIHKQTVTSCLMSIKQLPHNIEWTMIPIHKQTVTSCQYIYRMDHDTYT